MACGGRSVVDKLLSYLPLNKQVQLRTPRYKDALYPPGDPNRPRISHTNPRNPKPFTQ